MKKQILLASVLGIFLLNSCQKEEMMTPTSSSNQQSTYSTSRTSDDNVFDQYGQLHNDILNEVGIRGDVGSMSKKQRFDLSVQIISEQGVSSDELLSYGEINGITGYGNSLNAKNGVKKITDMTWFGTSEENILQDLLDLIEDIETNLELPLSTDEVNFRVSQIEAKILNTIGANIDETTGDVDKGGHLMVVCAITRYSYSFWMNVVADENHPWHPVVQNGNGNERCGIFCKIWRGIKKIARDIYGALFTVGLDPTLPLSAEPNAALASYNSANASGG